MEHRMLFTCAVWHLGGAFKGFAFSLALPALGLVYTFTPLIPTASFPTATTPRQKLPIVSPSVSLNPSLTKVHRQVRKVVHLPLSSPDHHKRIRNPARAGKHRTPQGDMHDIPQVIFLKRNSVVVPGGPFLLCCVFVADEVITEVVIMSGLSIRMTPVTRATALTALNTSVHFMTALNTPIQFKFVMCNLNRQLINHRPHCRVCSRQRLPVPNISAIIQHHNHSLPCTYLKLPLSDLPFLSTLSSTVTLVDKALINCPQPSNLGVVPSPSSSCSCCC
ncbi:hypothetical protein B0T21DRAFT_358563 [Apiosordaria backusii]|uniref:Uncharacterized protein n=1 Tax=Apiosordaria backusii TaxID=314023 RepID=A0AA40K3R9_9PEZI|nr:hypothetical protein B0T21DRAFT_358563 [Apiosordaria backusii]